MSQTSPDFAAIQRRQQQTWATGDFAVVGVSQLIVGELLCEAVDLRAGSRVLDIACGSGNTALAAARRFCEVIGVDFVPALLERGRQRAAAEGLDVDFRVGDAEQLPVPDASFDVVLSTFGVMFAPDQARAAGELLRVCRPGGTIGLANWTPESAVGEMFAITARYVPPPPGLMPASRWGTKEGVQALLGVGISDLKIERRNCVFRFRSPEHWLEVFRNYFGPVMQTLAVLDAAGQEAFVADLLDNVRCFNRSDDGTMAMPCEYLEVIAVTHSH